MRFAAFLSIDIPFLQVKGCLLDCLIEMCLGTELISVANRNVRCEVTCSVSHKSVFAEQNSAKLGSGERNCLTEMYD